MKVEVGPAWQLESNKLGYIVDDTMLGKVQGKLKPVVVEMDVLGGEAGIEAGPSQRERARDRVTYVQPQWVSCRRRCRFRTFCWVDVVGE